MDGPVAQNATLLTFQTEQKPLMARDLVEDHRHNGAQLHQIGDQNHTYRA